MADKYKIIVPDAGRTVSHSALPPFGTVVVRDTALPDLPNATTHVYHRDDQRNGPLFAAHLDEVQPLYESGPLKAPKDVSIEAVGAKATFTGTEAKVGAWAVSIVLVILAAAYFVAGCTVINNHGTVAITTEKK